MTNPQIPYSQPAPEQWRYDFEPGYCGEIVRANGTTVCTFTDEPNEADARLIATAPELLEACEAIVAWDEDEKAARPWNEDGGKGWHERLDACALAFEKARAAIAKVAGGAA